MIDNIKLTMNYEYIYMLSLTTRIVVKLCQEKAYKY